MVNEEGASYGRAATIRLSAGIRFDRRAHGVWSHQQLTPLPPVEYRLLDYFCSHPGQLITFPTLISVGWSSQSQPGRTATDVYRYIHRLRQVIERGPNHPQVLRTERGLGYVLLTSATRNW
ncbi:MAG: winged helix-turn-helix domain-containing protein [Firmicutes bacterium]|jgi:DNA-binding response OmpR family regulator|nr:winged helix-turn-helix domain-containing protein [Bacillota bacterium]MCL5064575.1 winged helix-turn-helix domain-containing protein [Bacillota bacterium]